MLYGACGNTLQPSSSIFYWVLNETWGRALSLRSRVFVGSMPFLISPWFTCSSCRQYRSLLTVWPLFSTSWCTIPFVFRQTRIDWQVTIHWTLWFSVSLKGIHLPRLQTFPISCNPLIIVFLQHPNSIANSRLVTLGSVSGFFGTFSLAKHEKRTCSNIGLWIYLSFLNDEMFLSTFFLWVNVHWRELQEYIRVCIISYLKKFNYA